MASTKSHVDQQVVQQNPVQTRLDDLPGLQCAQKEEAEGNLHHCANNNEHKTRNEGCDDRDEKFKFTHAHAAQSLIADHLKWFVTAIISMVRKRD